MKKRRWHGNDDDFDEIGLHDDLYYDVTKKRSRLRTVPQKRMPRYRSEDREQLKRISRVKAWGVPY